MITSFRSELPNEAQRLLRLALPVVTGQLFAMGMNVADTLLAGRYSGHALGVVAVGSAVWSLVIIIVLGFLYAVPPLVSELDGAGRREGIAAVVSQAIWLGLLIGVCLFFAVRQVGPVLVMMRVDPTLIADVVQFLRAISWGAPALALFFVLRYFSEGIGYSRATLYFSALGMALFIPIGSVLVFGYLGFPARGALGCAMAMALSLWLQVLAFIAFVLRHPVYRDLDLVQRFQRPRWSAMRHLLVLGLPIAFMVLMEGSMFVVAALLISRLGGTAVASHQIAINVGSVAFMVPLGIGAATTVRVGNALGAGDLPRLRAAVVAGLGLVLIAQLLLATSMAWFAGSISGWYTHEIAVVSLASQLLLVCAIFQFSDGLQAVASAALRGLKDVRLPAVLTLIAYWGIGMSLGAWLCFGHGQGATGMWWGLAAGLSASAVLLLTRLWILVGRRSPLGTSWAPPADPN